MNTWQPPSAPVAQPLGQFEVRVKTSSQLASLAMALVFIALGLVPRFVVQANYRRPGWHKSFQAELYDTIGWIFLTVLGLVWLVLTIRAMVSPHKTTVIAVHPDRLTVARGQLPVQTLPFAATPYVRDLQLRNGRHLLLVDPAKGQPISLAHPGLFADKHQYDQLSQLLQQAHSDFWLGPDFPASVDRLELEFSAKAMGDFAWRMGTFWRRGQPLQPGSISHYHLAPPVAGLSYNQNSNEVDVFLTTNGARDRVRLKAGAINHKVSLVRLLDAFDVPKM
ncbi:MAG: hypothetical protein LBK42_03310 [Propionibacteriaceae bacterium]|nr:hypothetical protein [Propionibacteriaceae bacterium]